MEFELNRTIHGQPNRGQSFRGLQSFNIALKQFSNH